VDVAQAWTDIGERVREAREAAGLTQSELAEATGLARTALVRIESGEGPVNAADLFRISDTLKLSPAHFVSRPPRAMVSRRQAISAAPTGADRARFHLDAALEQQARDTEWLVRQGLVTPPDLPPPADSQSPRELARYARHVLGEPISPLGPLAEVAERLGVYLKVVDLDVDGASVLLDSYSAAVVGAAPDPGRRRLTAAHEIGHHLLRDEYTAEVGGVSASRDERERLVDSFAGEFLLPTEALTSRFKGVPDGERRRRLIQVAGEHRISWSAVLTRAQQSGVISAGEAQRLRAQTPLRGDFVAVLGREPAPDLALGDRGPQWRQAVLRAYEEGLLAAPRVLELLDGDLTAADLPDRAELAQP
jgi:transcriptional regulator with XRE-family HTH domain